MKEGEALSVRVSKGKKGECNGNKGRTKEQVATCFLNESLYFCCMHSFRVLFSLHLLTGSHEEKHAHMQQQRATGKTTAACQKGVFVVRFMKREEREM